MRWKLKAWPPSHSWALSLKVGMFQGRQPSRFQPSLTWHSYQHDAWEYSRKMLSASGFSSAYRHPRTCFGTRRRRRRGGTGTGTGRGEINEETCFTFSSARKTTGMLYLD